MAYKGYYNKQVNERFTPQESGLEDVLAKLESAGVQLPNKKPKAGLLQRLGLILNTASPTTALYKNKYEGKNFLEEYGKSAAASLKGGFTGDIPEYDFKSGKDILIKEGYEDKKGKVDITDIGGLAIDILTDPTTYLTAGTAKGGATIAGKGGKVALSKGGTEFLEDALITAGKNVPREAVEREVAKIATETPKYLAKKGIRLAGQTIVPQEALEKVGLGKVGEKGLTSGTLSSGMDLLEKGVGKVSPKWGTDIAKGRVAVNSLFDPYAAIKSALPESQADNVVQLIKNAQRRTAGEQNAALDKIIELAKVAQKENPEAGKIIMNTVESQLKPASVLGDKAVAAGVVQKSLPIGDEAVSELGKIASTGNKQLDEIGNELIKTNKDIFEQEATRGLVKSEQELEGYMSHIFTPEAKKAVQDGTIQADEIKSFSDKLSSSKKRNVKGAVEQINAEFAAKNNGMKLFEDDAFKAVANRKMQSIRATNFYDLKSDIAREVGIPISKEKVVNGVRYVDSQVVPGTMIPKEVEEFMLKTESTFKNDKSIANFLKIYDKGLQLWKGSVTGLFPAFHSRNFLGGTFNNFLAGVDNPERYAQAGSLMTGAKGEITTQGGRKISFDEIREAMKVNNVTGQSGILDAQKNVDEIIKGLDRTGGKKVASDVAGLPQKAMTVVEDELRGALFIDRLIKGDSFEEATNQVMKYHFDYSKNASTKFENEVLKRIMPFYTWTRNNIPLQFEQLGQQPGKYAAILKAAQSTQLKGEEGKREQEFTPDYMKNQLNFRLGGDENKQLNVALPLEDLTRINPKEAYSLLSPILKVPIELTTNKNVFMDKEITNKTLPKEFQTSKAPIESIRKLPTPLKSFLNIKEVTNTDPNTGKETLQVEMDSTKLYLLNAALGRFISTGKSAEQDLNKEGMVKFLAKNFAGTPIRNVDTNQQEYFAAKDYDQMASAVLAVLRKQNKLPTAEEEKAAKIKLPKVQKGKYSKKKKAILPKKTTAQKNKEKTDKLIKTYRK